MLALLPAELILHVMEIADPASTKQLSLCCRRFRKIYSSFRGNFKMTKDIFVVLNFGESITIKAGKNPSGILQNLTSQQLKGFLEEISMFSTIWKWEIQGTLDDKALKCLLEIPCLELHAKNSWMFDSCELDFDMKLWNRFLSMVRPGHLLLTRSRVKCPSVFATETIESGLSNAWGLKVDHDVIFDHENAKAELINLLQLKAKLLIVGRQFPLEADSIFAKIERWIQGAEEITLYSIGYRQEDFQPLLQRIHAIPGSYPNSQFGGDDRNITNVNGGIIHVRPLSNGLSIRKVSA